MVAELNRLGELAELDSLPAWLRHEIASRREEIQRELETKGYIILAGPAGEQVKITIKQKVAAA